jgi:hypothetical protein
MFFTICVYDSSVNSFTEEMNDHSDVCI